MVYSERRGWRNAPPRNVWKRHAQPFRIMGWLLDERDREALLARIPPAYENAVAHHVTLRRAKEKDDAAPPAGSAEIVGVADDGKGVQALAVRLNGTTDRPDGSTYHITWSLAEGRRPKESNDILATHGWTPLPRPIPIRLHVAEHVG